MASSKGGLQVLDRKSFAVGAPVCRRGDSGQAAYIVQSGEIEIWVSTDGIKTVLGTIKAGGIFGEMSLIDNSARMASATAVKPSVCIIISARVFEDKLSKADPFIIALLRIFCSNIRSMQETASALVEELADS